uniref:SMP-30/Gluconolactonase/LRE-like region domain-containing protein n=1 Tax=Podospora anserina (strain S / ATCC MYA-4624 / DSM 980 / FGSC 10383) TaxID=515849 RepID=A0A090CWV1_PODAN|nr:Putative protein of unknown function [Podospora anserina S mat+]
MSSEFQVWEVKTPYLNLHCGLGEGPYYEPATQTVRFVDIKNKKLHTVSSNDPADLVTLSFDEPVTVTADIAGVDPKDKILIGAKQGLAVLDRKTGEYEYISKMEGEGVDRIRSNDGAVDPQGRFWMGSMTDFGKGDFRPEASVVHVADPGWGDFNVVAASIEWGNRREYQGKRTNDRMDTSSSSAAAAVVIVLPQVRNNLPTPPSRQAARSRRLPGPLTTAYAKCMYVQQTAQTKPIRSGSLLRFTQTSPPQLALTSLTIPNSVGWSPDQRTMYFTHSNAREVLAWDYDPSPSPSSVVTLSNKRIFYQHVGSGEPDGFRVDVEGNIWHAVYGESRVLKLSPEGKLIGEVRLPTRNITCVEFVGEELFITTAGDDGAAEGEESKVNGGALFRVDVGVRGVGHDLFRL